MDLDELRATTGQLLAPGRVPARAVGRCLSRFDGAGRVPRESFSLPVRVDLVGVAGGGRDEPVDVDETTAADAGSVWPLHPPAPSGSASCGSTAGVRS